MKNTETQKAVLKIYDKDRKLVNTFSFEGEGATIELCKCLKLKTFQKYHGEIRRLEVIQKPYTSYDYTVRIYYNELGFNNLYYYEFKNMNI